MAFKLDRIDVMATTPAEVQAATASEAYAVGEALKLVDGRVTKASGTDVPVYICAGERPAGEVDAPIPCHRVNKLQTWATPLSADGGTLKIGDKVTIAADGLQVTATTEGGVAEVVRIYGTAVGDQVAVRL